MENQKTVLILDYDGTLHNTGVIYEPAFRKVMKEISDSGWIPAKEYTKEEILYWVGFSASEMWERFQPQLALEKRQEAGKRIGDYMFEEVKQGRGRLYPGTEQVLEKLCADYELVFFSNCDRNYVDTHRQAFSLDRFISSFYCTGDYGVASKEEVFSKNIYDSERKYIIIGDRIKDKRLAEACNLPFVGCLYGFGTEEELSPAEALIQDIRELPDAIRRIETERKATL